MGNIVLAFEVDVGILSSHKFWYLCARNVCAWESTKCGAHQCFVAFSSQHLVFGWKRGSRLLCFMRRLRIKGFAFGLLKGIRRKFSDEWLEFQAFLNSIPLQGLVLCIADAGAYHDLYWTRVCIVLTWAECSHCKHPHCWQGLFYIRTSIYVLILFKRAQSWDDIRMKTNIWRRCGPFIADGSLP